MTKKEFTKKICDRRKITEKQLLEDLGLVVVPCNCGSSYCKGWWLEAIENIEAGE